MAKNYTIEEILEAVENSAGIMSVIAKKLDCQWHIAKKYVNSYEETKQALLNEVEKTKDLAERTIIQELGNNDLQTAKWYLSTIGKDRGYTEKRELEHSGNLTIIEQLSQLNDDELKKMKDMNDKQIE